MAIAYRASSEGHTTSSGGSGNVDLPVPVGTISGDFMVAVLARDYGGGYPTTPAGWTLLEHSLSTFAELSIYYRVATSSEPTSYQWTASPAVALRMAGVIVSWSGVDTSNPIAANSISPSSPASSSVTAPSVTPPSPTRVMAVFDADWQFASLSLPGILTLRQQTQPTGGTGLSPLLLVADFAQSAMGATGDMLASDASRSGYGVGAQIALRSLNNPPNAPVPTSPANNASVDRSQPITLSATFSDPDPGDSPSASQWRYRAVGAATWTTVEVDLPVQNYSIPAGLAAGDYEWQAAYADQSGTWGPFCGSAFFTAADPPPGPTWLDPTSGQTIGTSSYTGVISTPSLDKSEWTLYADNNGAISSTVLQGPVTVTTGDLRSHTFTDLANNVAVWWSVRTSSGGLWSQPVQIRTPVSYTPPAAPTVALTPYSDAGLLDIAITNPAPGAGEPTVSYNDVYVDDGQGLGWERVATMLAPSTDWTYALPRSGYEYSGHVKVRAIASNGTTSEAIA